MVRERRKSAATSRFGNPFFMMAAAALVAWSPQVVWGEIHWRSGPAEMAPLDQAELASAITQLAGREDARRVVVQFDRSIGSAERGQLQQAGLRRAEGVRFRGSPSSPLLPMAE